MRRNVHVATVPEGKPTGRVAYVDHLDPQIICRVILIGSYVRIEQVNVGCHRVILKNRYCTHIYQPWQVVDIEGRERPVVQLVALNDRVGRVYFNIIFMHASVGKRLRFHTDGNLFIDVQHGLV